MTTTDLARAPRRKPSKNQRVAQQRASGNVSRRSSLPEHLERVEVEGLIHSAPHGQSRLHLLMQWRAGLRVSEAVALAVEDLQLDGDHRNLRVRRGKGGKDRIVPVHPELAAAFRQVFDFAGVRRSQLVSTTRSSAWWWTKVALARARELGTIPIGRWVGTHTLRHSAARHWMASGVPINHVSRWLGTKEPLLASIIGVKRQDRLG